LLSALLTAPVLPLFDPDEGYYPATAAESVDAGQFWDLRFNGEPRWDKPLLSYALIEASFAVGRRSVTASRLPSAIEGFLLVLIVGATVARLAGRSAASVCAAVLGSMLGLQIFARVSHPEVGVVLAIATTELLFVLYLFAEPPRRHVLAALAGVAIGFGILTKGPVALALPSLAAAAALPFVRPLIRSWRSAAIDAAAALAVAGLIAAPWYLAMTIRHGAAFVDEALWRHNVGRYAGSNLGHHAGLLFFVVPTLVALLPWSMFLAGAVRAIDRADRSPVGILRIVAACSAATGFIFYSLSASKLPHYSLAFVPPLAILIGLYVSQQLGESMPRRRLVVMTAAVLGILGIALLVLPWTVGHVLKARELLGGAPLRGGAIQTQLAQAVVPAALALFVFAALLVRSNFRRAVALTIGAGAALPVVLLLSAAPMLRAAYPWDQFGRQISGTVLPIWLIGPRAPSLTFFAAHPVTMVSEDDLSRMFRSGGVNGWVIADATWLRDANASHRFPEVLIDPLLTSGVKTLAMVHPAQSAQLPATSPMHRIGRRHVHRHA